MLRQPGGKRTKEQKGGREPTRTMQHQREHVIEEGLLKYDNNKDRIYTRNCI